jgi:hypothetical protein
LIELALYTSFVGRVDMAGIIGALKPINNRLPLSSCRYHLMKKMDLARMRPLGAPAALSADSAPQKMQATLIADSPWTL